MGVTSGAFETNVVGGLGSSPNRMRFEWSLASQNIAGNYSTINWNIRGVGGAGGYWTRNFNARTTIHGSLVQSTGAFDMYQNSVFGSGSFNIGHDSAGNMTFGASAVGRIYYNTDNSSGSGAWELPTIPRHATLNSAPNFTDEQNPTINFSNPAGTGVDVYLETPYNGGAGFANRYLGGANGNYTFDLSDAERNTIRSRMPSSNSMVVRFVVHDSLGGVNSWSYLDRTVTLVNGNPTFADFDYKDSNSATVAITGNDQFIIQGQSTLELKVLSADKATANKYATMVKYNSAISSINQDTTYSTSDVTQALGVLNVNTDTVLAVKAIDSRGNFTTVNKTVSVLPYVPPQVTPTVKRVNDFETETDISVAGVFSQLTIASVDKNAVNATTGVKYRYKKVEDVSWSSWVDLANTTSGGNIAVAEFTEDFDRNFAWNMEFSITDKITTSVTSYILPVGKPIFRIGLDGHVYNNEIELATVMQRLPYYNGDIGSGTGVGNKSLGVSRELNYGIEKTNSTTLTVETKGVYEIQIQQLISTVSAGYLQILVNGSALAYGYYEGNTMDDTGASIITELDVDDTIQVYQTNAITTSWQAQHSNISVKCLARL